MSNSFIDELVKEEGKEKKPTFTAYFNDLVDIVFNDDELKFLLSSGECVDERIVDNYRYCVPPIKGLPPLNYFKIPRLSEVENYAQNHGVSGDSGEKGVCKGCTQLFYDLVQYNQKFFPAPTADEIGIPRVFFQQLRDFF